MKNILLACGIVLVSILVLICLMFFVLSLPKYRDGSADKPFSEIVNKKLTTKKKVLILLYPGIPKYETYAYHLEDGSSFGMDSGLEVIAEIPIGTEFIIDKVELHTGRVSGTTSPYLFGKIYSEEKKEEYAFQFTWGDHHSLYEDKPYWTFKLAFWQDQPLTQKYFIKTK